MDNLQLEGAVERRREHKSVASDNSGVGHVAVLVQQAQGAAVAGSGEIEGVVLNANLRDFDRTLLWGTLVLKRVFISCL